MEDLEGTGPHHDYRSPAEECLGLRVRTQAPDLDEAEGQRILVIS